ncbi:MAG: hypothetical protein ACO3D2_05245 [Holophagaceae bacterium]
METCNKNIEIKGARAQLLATIPDLEAGGLLPLEESFLFVNFYDYISRIDYNQRIELDRLLKAINKLNRNLTNNDIVPPDLYSLANELIVIIRNYPASYRKFLSNRSLKELAFPINAHLVRLVEVFSSANRHINWNLNLKSSLGSYLIHYVRIRTRPNDYAGDTDERSLDPRTYNVYLKQFEESPDTIPLIDEELARSRSTKVKEIAISYAKREKEKSPKSYFPEVDGWEPP